MAGGREYVERMVRRARELRASDAFEPAAGARFSAADARAARDRADTRRRSHLALAAFAALLAVVAGMSLCLPYYGVNAMGVAGQMYAPGDVADCWGLWFKLNVAPLFDPALRNRAGLMLAEFATAHPGVVYQLVVQRGAVTLAVGACGVLLAVSGMLFQTAFRNPLATPTMLGVSDGVTLGCIVFAGMGFSSATDSLGLYFLCVYGFGAVAVVAVIMLGRAVGGGRANVFDMLLIGTVICQLLGGVNSYISNFGMDSSTWQRFYDVQQAGDVLNQPQTWVVVAVVFAATVAPLVVSRFRFNLISFPDDETRVMGARPAVLRGCALVMGSVMQLAAIASIGQVAMLSLAVPFLVRYLMPSEFRFQLVGNVLLGVLVLLACVDVQHFAMIGSVSVPVGTLIAVLIVPFFVWAVALQSNRWGD